MPLETNARVSPRLRTGCERFHGPAPTVLQPIDLAMPTARVAAAEGKPLTGHRSACRGRAIPEPTAPSGACPRANHGKLPASHRYRGLGGAAGLELATKLGHGLGRREKAQVTLVRAQPHSYLEAAPARGGRGHPGRGPQCGRLSRPGCGPPLSVLHGGDDRPRPGRARYLTWSATYDAEGEGITPARSIVYDTLVIAVGSTSNDFR